MKRLIFSLSGLFLVFCFPAASVSVAQWTLVSRSGGTSWQIQEVARVTFNQRDRLRIGPDMRDFEAKQYKKLRPVMANTVGIIRRHAGGFLVRKNSNGAWEPLLPDGLSQKVTSYKEAWQGLNVEFRKERNTKVATTVPLDDILAILQGSDANMEVVNFLSDDSNFRGLGEKDEQAGFEEHMSLLVGVAPSMTGDAAAKLKQLLFAKMDGAAQRLRSGIAKYAVLEEGLRYVPVSEKAFPDDALQKSARESLQSQDGWVNRRIAILKAMAAGSLWDALIDAYGDFERWDNSFADMPKLREAAFKASTEEHVSAAERLRAAKQFSLALKDLEIALKRSPESKAIADLLDEVKSEAEADRGGIKDRKQEVPGSPEYRRVTRYLADADNYASPENGQMEEAEQQLAQAKTLAPGSPRVMYARAKLYDAEKQPINALKALDEYMRNVSSEKEIDDGEKLRSKISLTLNTAKKNLRKAIDKAEAEGDFPAAMKAAQEGLDLDPTNLEFLLYGGKESAILRNKPHAVDLLNKYLSVASSSTTSKKAEVYKMLEALAKASASEPNGSADGTPSWFSAYRSEAGLFYCPVSLAPKPHISTVKARKEFAVYEWAGGGVTTIHTTTQEKGAPPFQVYFDYFGPGKSVRRVSTEPFGSNEDPPLPKFTPSDTESQGKAVYVKLATHPVVDPIMVARLTGKSTAVLVAGNPYFQPFVWSAIHVFMADYDDRGRVASAREIGADQPHRVLDFKWDGDSGRLIEVSERGGAYRREMTYSGDRLTSETVTFGRKTSKIEYKYSGSQLTAARCDDDPSLDNRNCTVSFQ
jgi:hypothetical protein